MLAKTKSRRSSQDFYRMANLAGMFEHLSSRISKIVHFLASLHRLILLYPLYYMGRYGGKERKALDLAQEAISNLEQQKKRGCIYTWGFYSSKLRAVPHSYQKLVPLNALLPVALRYPLNIYILL